jgi:tetratricopeptide (TPR) repeat protein
MSEFRVAVIVLWVLSAACAQAAIPPAALNAFHAGQFAKSSSIAETEASAPSLAFAARARIADALTHSDGVCTPCLLDAQTLAERAIALNPNLIEGHIQYAVAIGFRGRDLGIVEAQSQRLAEKARRSLDKALELDRENTWALASLGAWHLEIVHHAGPILAEIAYGASRSRGLELYRRALNADPSNIILHVHFALSILALDQDDFHEEALEALTAAINVPTNDALNMFNQNQARQLVESLQSSDPRKIAPLVRRFQGFAD